MEEAVLEARAVGEAFDRILEVIMKSLRVREVEHTAGDALQEAGTVGDGLEI
jgi:hypothetical protein